MQDKPANETVRQVVYAISTGVVLWSAYDLATQPRTNAAVALSVAGIVVFILVPLLVWRDARRGQ